RGDNVLTDDAKKEAVYRMYAGYKKDFPAVIDISPLQAMELQAQDKVVFVDTRKPAEMAVSILPGAVSEEDYRRHLDRYQGRTVIAYCTISYRSGLFAREMAARGIHVVNLQGGILAWLLEGGTVVDSQGRPTRRVHVYGSQWDYAPSGYESVRFSLWRQAF
ncbi:MAG: rhodanese-like domain-containing protein, partial [Desulfobacterales bacterium]